MLITARGNRVYLPDGDVLTDFLWDRSRFVCVQGPIGSGTSTASCHRIWLLACEQEPDWDGVRRTRWIISRQTYKQLRETTLKTWLDWFPESEWGALTRAEPMFHKLERKHPSGDGTRVDCEVIFLAVPDAESAENALASFEITGFFVNEGQFTDKAVVDELLSRCSRYPSMSRGPGATWFGGWMDMNAPVEGHWVPYMRGDLPLPIHMTEDQRLSLEKPAGWRFLVQPPGLIEVRGEGGRIVYQPNPLAENQRHLRETYLEKVRGKEKSWIDRRVLNKIGLYPHGQPVYPTFSETEHILKTDAAPVSGLPILVGLDFGREPAAAFGQNVNGAWRVYSELIGSNESAQLFAPRVKHHLATHYGGFEAEFWGDPRGADGTQGMETTAYDVFRMNGMVVLPATTDNNPEMRRSTMERAFERRNGFAVNPTCLVLKTGLAGAYHYPKVNGMPGQFRPSPAKNRYSHIVEAVENMLLGGGEGFALVRPPEHMRKAPGAIYRPRVKFRSRR